MDSERNTYIPNFSNINLFPYSCHKKKNLIIIDLDVRIRRELFKIEQVPGDIPFKGEVEDYHCIRKMGLHIFIFFRITDKLGD